MIWMGKVVDYERLKIFRVLMVAAFLGFPVSFSVGRSGRGLIQMGFGIIRVPYQYSFTYMSSILFSTLKGK